MPALPTNLVKVGSTYKFRSRIPQDLLRYYQPRQEITESLRTKSLAEARRLLPAVQLKYQQEWDNLRAALSEDFAELPLNDATTPYLAACFAHESLGGDERTRLEGHYTLEENVEYRERLSKSITYLQDLAVVGDIQVIKPALDYVQHIQAQHNDWLFPHLVPDRYGKRGANWSKWWTRWRRPLGVDGA